MRTPRAPTDSLPSCLLHHHTTACPKEGAALDPVAWVAAAVEGGGGGRSGGKAPRGQGTGDKLENIDAAQAAALKFAGL